MQQAPTNISDLPSYLFYLLLNPTFNLTAAFILYAILVAFLLAIMVLGILMLTGPRRDDAAAESSPEEDQEFDRVASGEAFEGYDEQPVPPARQRLHRERKPRRQLSPRGRLLLGTIGILLLVAAWLLAGYTTSRPSLCKGCHWPAAQHTKAVAGSDDHAGVSCVSCHESGGVIGRYFTGVPGRVAHLIDVNSEEPKYEYGAVTTMACSRCHEENLEGVVSNETRGLKMSHKEPLEASATCIDCHALSSGVVGTHNAGMDPCLRCHDAAAESAQCSVCHDTKAAAAARARTSSFTKEQITDLSCGGCHDEAQQCDPCHGVRMPHSTEFKMYAHSRSGAVDFWYNGGKTCSKCHTAERRPCQQCHSSIIGIAHGRGANSIVRGHQVALVSSCDTCHKQWAYSANRDFCQDLCHSPAAIANSPR